jgi:AraC family transcriptional regulator
MNVVIRTLEPMRVAYLRAIGPYQQEFPKLWPKFAALAGARGLFKPGVKAISLCHDSPKSTPADQLRGDACVTIDESFQGDDALKVQTIDGGRYAVAQHVGPYADLPKTWHALANEWMPTSGQTPRNKPSFEIYVNDPSTTPETELLTEIHIPIE